MINGLAINCNDMTNHKHHLLKMDNNTNFKRNAST